MKVVMVNGQSTYNVVRHFLIEIAEGLRAYGCDVEVLDFYLGDGEGVVRRLRELQDNPPDIVFSFNGIGYNMIRKYMNQVPYIGWLVDSPIIHHPRLIEWDCNSYAVCVDQLHADMIRRFYANVGDAWFLPHAGSSAQTVRSYSERTIDVLFGGGYTPSDTYLHYMEDEMTPTEQGIAYNLIIKMQEQNLSLEQALEQLLIENKVEFSNDEFTVLCLHYLDTDYFIRTFYREELIRTLLNNGIYVDVYGKGWDQFRCDNRQFLNVHEPVDYTTTMELMGNAKIVLNSLPNFKQGGHERIFSAMLNGAVCVTDSNEYLEKNFVNGENVVMFSRNYMENAAEQIRYWLSHEEQAEQLALAGRKIAKVEHTWNVRAKQLMAIMETIVENN